MKTVAVHPHLPCHSRPMTGCSCARRPTVSSFASAVVGELFVAALKNSNVHNALHHISILSSPNVALQTLRCRPTSC